MDNQKAFYQLVEKDFAEAEFDTLKLVALSIWYEDFVPNVNFLDPKSARAACYLLDRLMRYNCVTYDRQNELLKLIDQLTLKYNIQAIKVEGRDRNLSKAAIKWGVKSDLKVLLKKMTPYQTRHYRHDK